MLIFLQVGELGLPQFVKGTEPGSRLLPNNRGEWAGRQLYFKLKGGGTRQGQVEDSAEEC